MSSRRYRKDVEYAYLAWQRASWAEIETFFQVCEAGKGSSAYEELFKQWKDQGVIARDLKQKYEYLLENEY